MAASIKKDGVIPMMKVCPGCYYCGMGQVLHMRIVPRPEYLSWLQRDCAGLPEIRQFANELSEWDGTL